MLFNIFEIIDIVLMTLVIGYIFHDTFRKPVAEDDVLAHYRKKKHGPLGIEWHDFWWASALVAPTIIIHELAHKFTAIGFGLSATFYSACTSAALVGAQVDPFMCGLTVVAVILKTVGFGFIFFVPGFVSVGVGGTNLQNALISFAGPAVHLIFWLGAAYLLKSKTYMRKLPQRKQLYLFFFKQINMFLFILNMLPIPGFDGFNFLYHLIKSFM